MLSPAHPLVAVEALIVFEHGVVTARRVHAIAVASRAGLVVGARRSYAFSNLWLIFGKLCEARSRLYRRRFLQVNTRLKALDEIYKIYTFLHRSDLNISAKVRQTFENP